MNVAFVATLVALPSLGLGAVLALDVEEPGLDALLRAVSFSPWGMVMVYIFWNGKRELTEVLQRLAALWAESLRVARAWVAAIDNLTATLRAQHGMEPLTSTRPGRPRTNPINLPFDVDGRERDHR